MLSDRTCKVGVISHLLILWLLLMLHLLHRLLLHRLRVKAEGKGLRLRPVRPDAVEDDGEANIEDEEEDLNT